MQLALLQRYAEAATFEDLTDTLRDFLNAETKAEKVSILRNACKIQALAMGFRNLSFNFIDEAFVRRMLESSHKCTPKDTFDVGSTFNIMLCCDVSAKVDAEKRALGAQFATAGLSLTKAELSRISDAVLALPTPGQGIKYVQRGLCLCTVLYGKDHWSAEYLAAYEQDIKHLMEEDILHNSPLREIDEWTLVDPFVTVQATYNLGAKVKAIEEEVDASRHPDLEPQWVSRHVENNTYWQPVIREQAAKSAELQRFHRYVQATYRRPTSDAGYTVTRHASSISLAEDDQVTVASLQLEIANLQRQVAAQGGARRRTPLPVREEEPRASSAGWAVSLAPPREGAVSAWTTPTSARKSLAGPAMQPGEAPARLA